MKRAALFLGVVALVAMLAQPASARPPWLGSTYGGVYKMTCPAPVGEIWVFPLGHAQKTGFSIVGDSDVGPITIFGVNVVGYAWDGDSWEAGGSGEWYAAPGLYDVGMLTRCDIYGPVLEGTSTPSEWAYEYGLLDGYGYWLFRT